MFASAGFVPAKRDIVYKSIYFGEERAMSEDAKSGNRAPRDIPRGNRPTHASDVPPSNLSGGKRPSATLCTRLAPPSSECEAASIDAEKIALRRAALTRRDAIDAGVRAQRSSRISDALMNEVLLGAGAVGEGCSRDTQDRAGSPDPRGAVTGPAAFGHATPGFHRPTVAVYAAFGSEADPSTFAQAAELAGWRIAYPCMLPREETEAGMPEGGVASNAAGCGQRMCMRAVCWRDRTAAPFLVHPTHAFAERDIDGARFPVVSARELDAIVVPLVAFDARGMRLGYGGGCYDRYLPTLSAACRILGIAFAEQQVEAVPVGEHDLPLPRIITA